MPMDFFELQESLRRVVADKIRQHEFTGSSLAKGTGSGKRTFPISCIENVA
jgi:hypothetical protein